MQTQFAKNNALRRRYYIMLPVGKADHKKLRRWLDKGTQLEIATDGDSKILITNETAIMATPKSRELFGIKQS